MDPRFLLSALLAVSAVAAGNPPISETQLAKLRDMVLEEKFGSYNPAYDMSVALGLPTSRKNPYQVKYNAKFVDDESKDKHGFGYSKAMGDYLLDVSTKSHVKYLRFGPDLKLVATAMYRRGNDMAETIPPAEAAALLDRELTFWAKRAESGN